MSSIHWNVAPRYTGGSPAQVPEHIATRVAHEEKVAYDRALDDLYGDDMKREAEARGLGSIVEKRTEHATGWVVQDMCTGISFFRPLALTMPRVRTTPRATAKRGKISLRDRVYVYTRNTMYRGRVLDLCRYNTSNHKKTAYPGDTIVIEGRKRSITDIAGSLGTYRVDIVGISEVSIEL